MRVEALRTATVAHVPMAFSTSGSTLLEVVDQLSRSHDAEGGRSLAILSHNRGLTLRYATPVYVDHTENCRRQYFTRTETAVDVLFGRAGATRPFHGRLHEPSVRAVRDNDAQVVLLYEGHFAAASLPYWNDLRPSTKIVLYVHNPLSRTYGRRELRRMTTLCDAMVFCADHLREQALRRMPHAELPMVTIYNGIDPVFLSAPKLDQPIGADFEILFLGRAAPHKGPQHLLAALDGAQALTSRVLRATIVGSENYGQIGAQLTPFEHELRRLADETPVSVEFVPHVDRSEAVQLMRRASALCIPSVWPEGLPLVALEALAMGLPVVAFEARGVVEACGDTALYAPVGDAARLAQRIAETANDPAATATRVRRGRERALDFSWERSWRQFADLLTAL